MSKKQQAGDKPSQVPQSSIGRPRSEAMRMPIFDTMAQCEAFTGCPVALQKKAKAAGCDGFEHSRVNSERLFKWYFSQESAGVDFNALFEEYRAKREKIKHDREAKEAVGRSEVVFGLGKIEAAMFSMLERAQQELPAAVKGCDEATVFRKFGERIAEIKGELKLKFTQLAEGQA